MEDPAKWTELKVDYTTDHEKNERREHKKDVICSLAAGGFLTAGLIIIGINPVASLCFGVALFFKALTSGMLFY